MDHGILKRDGSHIMDLSKVAPGLAVGFLWGSIMAANGILQKTKGNFWVRMFIPLFMALSGNAWAAFGYLFVLMTLERSKWFRRACRSLVLKCPKLFTELGPIRTWKNPWRSGNHGI